MIRKQHQGHIKRPFYIKNINNNINDKKSATHLIGLSNRSLSLGGHQSTTSPQGRKMGHRQLLQCSQPLQAYCAVLAQIRYERGWGGLETYCLLIQSFVTLNAANSPHISSNSPHIAWSASPIPLNSVLTPMNSVFTSSWKLCWLAAKDDTV